MNDYLNLGGDDPGSGGDFRGDGGSYLNLDDPPPPGAPDVPMPVDPFASSTAPGGGEGGYLGDAGFLGDMGEGSDSSTSGSDAGYFGTAEQGSGSYLADGPGGYLAEAPRSSAPAGGIMTEPAPGSGFFDEPMPSPGQGFGGSAIAAAPRNPEMGGFNVQAPMLEDVRPSRAPSGGAVRGDLSSLVLDVDVQVEVYFGDATLTVEEFLEMGAGSVVELDHPIEAPIELRVRGRLIARGQLVTINGNYGLRVTDMVGDTQ